jgi:hydroxymethylpyrimidine pyrophosphatase-like HAD family hydrolase
LTKKYRLYAAYKDFSNIQLSNFRDGYNDKSMLMLAGFGVAMKNGQAAVKAVADYVAPSNEEDGVAYVVEKMMNGEKLS